MKPQVLVYGNRKQDDMQFPFSTQAEKELAFLKLFRYLRQTWKVYSADDMPLAQTELYTRVLDGDGAAAIKLLTLRKTYEYEVWHIENVPAKGKERLSASIALKPHWGEVKEVRTRREGSDIPSVTLVLANHRELTFLLVPFMATSRDWDDLNAASHFITDALSTEWKGELYAAEGLKEALDALNELRVALHQLQHPETAPPLASDITTRLPRILSRAEDVITKYSNTPLEKLSTTKRRPSTFVETLEELAKAKRTIASLFSVMKRGNPVEIKYELERLERVDEKAIA